LFVGGLDMRVSADECADVTIKHADERGLLRGGLGVEVNENQVGAAPETFDLGAGGDEGIVEIRHERATLEVEDGDRGLVAGLEYHAALTRRPLRIVKRAQEARLTLKQADDFLLVPEMVAGRNDVHTRAEDFARGVRRDARAAGGVLPVGDDQVRLMLTTQPGQEFLHRPASRFANDVADEKDLHRAKVGWGAWAIKKTTRTPGILVLFGLPCRGGLTDFLMMHESCGNDPTLSVGDRRTLSIGDIAFGGEGVGRLGEFVVFVPFVAVGETVDVEITEVKKRFARARLVRVAQASPHRVEAPCRYFGDCGGCQYQHIDYPVQLELKHKQICDLFERIGGFPGAVIEPVIPCPTPYGYRNRIMIRSQWDKFKQALNIGFIRADNRLVVDIDECRIAEPALNEQIRHVRAHPPPKGGIKVVLRIAPEGWEVPRDSFFQTNFFLLPELVRVARERLRESGARYLADIYCGVGFFSLELADQVERFAGIELDAQAIKAARRNASGRGCANGEFFAGRAEEMLPAVLARFSAAQTAVLLDPPRTGCPDESLQVLRQAAPRQIIYVSCHPATMARDLNALCAGGVFELVKVNPLDMFPQTAHVECVADLRLKSPVSR
jgi:tRNA/tmRNA/rRNA uracil-C5-methylase (TrmA/RlmC/RlmD family)